MLSILGRHEEAIAEGERARELEPVSLIINALNGSLRYYAGRFEEAAACLQTALDLEPEFWVARLFLGKIQSEQKHYGEAIAELERVRKSSRENSETHR